MAVIQLKSGEWNITESAPGITLKVEAISGYSGWFGFEGNNIKLGIGLSSQNTTGAEFAKLIAQSINADFDMKQYFIAEADGETVTVKTKYKGLEDWFTISVE